MGTISREDDNGAVEENQAQTLDIKDISSKELSEIMGTLAEALQEDKDNPDDRVISETTKKGQSR